MSLVLALVGCNVAGSPAGLAHGDPDGSVAPAVPLGPLPPTDRVDLLFVIDDSCSMTEEQASLTTELPRLIQLLASGDLDEDDVPEGPRLDVQVGVVTTDMGTGGYTVPTCARSDLGGDGILRTTGRTDIAGCPATLPPFTACGEDDPGCARDLACVATVGTGGCGFEQPLDAALKALTPSRAPIEFHAGTRGHGDGANAGFLREGSVLAIVVVTDEEDSSARDPAIFDPERSDLGDLNLRFFVHGASALHPISRYVDGLLDRRADPRRLVYFPMAGIPADLEPAPDAAPDWERLISEEPAVRDDRMEERTDPGMPSRLIPSCNVPGRGVAFPPVRIVRLARELERAGAQVGVASVCREVYRDSMTALARRIAAAARGAP